jgi:hypothetical protein
MKSILTLLPLAAAAASAGLTLGIGLSARLGWRLQPWADGGHLDPVVQFSGISFLLSLSLSNALIRLPLWQIVVAFISLAIGAVVLGNYLDPRPPITKFLPQLLIASRRVSQATGYPLRSSNLREDGVAVSWLAGLLGTGELYTRHSTTFQVSAACSAEASVGR